MDLLAQYPPRHFFCVSTDKAANPVNIMGASKRIMEGLEQREQYELAQILPSRDKARRSQDLVMAS